MLLHFRFNVLVLRDNVRKVCVLLSLRKDSVHFRGPVHTLQKLQGWDSLSQTVEIYLSQQPPTHLRLGVTTCCRLV